MARIAVDFDGVLYLGPASFGADLAACDPDPYTWAALDTLTHAGHHLVVFSARAGSPDGRKAIIEWLATHKLGHYFEAVTHEKLGAALYIDDRALRHEGDWRATCIDALELLDGRGVEG